MGMLVSSIILYEVLWHQGPEGLNGSRTERVKIRVGDWRCGLQEEPTPRLSLYLSVHCCQTQTLFIILSVGRLSSCSEFNLPGILGPLVGFSGRLVVKDHLPMQKM